MAMATSQANGKSKSHLTLWILAAILLAIVFSLWRPAAAENLHAGGEIFLRLLKMMVVPLVVTSVMSGILGMGDVRRLGKQGCLTFASLPQYWPSLSA